MLKELVIDQDGWLKGGEHNPSPNYEPRPELKEVKLIVVHAISLPPGKYGGGFVEKFFINQLDIEEDEYFEEIKDLRVSAHCFISRTGEITQFVSFDDRAWHAGISCWQEETDCNDFSIGIELEGCDDDAFETVQYQQLAALVSSLREHYPALTAESICGHSDIAPGRKTDPGPFFDWQKLAQHMKNLP